MRALPLVAAIAVLGLLLSLWLMLAGRGMRRHRGIQRKGVRNHFCRTESVPDPFSGRLFRALTPFLGHPTRPNMLLFFFAFLSADPKGRFLADYPSEVQELRREFGEARGIAIVRSPGDRTAVSPKTFRFAVGLGRRKFEFERAVGMPSGKVSVNGYSIFCPSRVP